MPLASCRTFPRGVLHNILVSLPPSLLRPAPVICRSKTVDEKINGIEQGVRREGVGESETWRTRKVDRGFEDGIWCSESGSLGEVEPTGDRPAAEVLGRVLPLELVQVGRVRADGRPGADHFDVAVDLLERVLPAVFLKGLGKFGWVGRVREREEVWVMKGLGAGARSEGLSIEGVNEGMHECSHLWR